MHRLCLLTAALWALTTAAFAQNLGHRMGGDVYAPENTLRCYKLALKNLQDKPEFHYVELDVQETADGQIVVFHDTGTIKRIVPKSSRNRATLSRHLRQSKFEKLSIADLTLAQVERLELKHNARIPTLKEVLDKSVQWKLRKPLLVEVKALRTDPCRQEVIELVARYRDKLDVNFLAFAKAFRVSFPDSVRWSHELKRRELKVFTALEPKTDEFDLAKLAAPAAPGLRFETLLPETHFSIEQEQSRMLRFPIEIPRARTSGLRLRVGVEHGYDDTGDRSARFRVLDSTGRVLLSGASNSRTWRWFEVPLDEPMELTLEVEDHDTKLTGKHAGNSGRVKVNLAHLEQPKRADRR